LAAEWLQGGIAAVKQRIDSLMGAFISPAKRFRV